MRNFLFFLLVIPLLHLSCSKEEEKPDLFGEEVQNILSQCWDNPLTDPEAIKAQLIGDWELLGYACGHCVPHTPPAASITFAENTGIFNYKSEQEEITLDFNWSLEEEDRDSGRFRLVTDPEYHALNITNFCDNYMFHDGRAYDGALHLYQKQ